ncbi:MAG: hypothetical protein Q8Q09_11315 [Deltaproteobacteria bacterium]|nr:hypothetical protein [Deltaproteobacteria bacterium]
MLRTYGGVLAFLAVGCAVGCTSVNAMRAPDSVAMDATVMDQSTDDRRDTALDAVTDGACAAGLTLCNGECVNSQTDLQNCGSCGTACPAAGPSQAVACLAGTCRSTCEAGFDDCTMAPGCETNLGTSTEHCGRCNSRCSLPNATARCTTATCDIASCATGFANCDGDVSNGCETSVTSISNCGACGTVCSFANATPVCTAGACGLGTCLPGFADCDRNRANGCETQLNTTSNCGACGMACSGATPFCDAAMGRCASGCTAPAVRCGATCVDVASSSANCGTCGNNCSYANASGTCASSVCTLGACGTGFGNCDGNAANGCETNLNTNAQYCGACGTRCAFANAAAGCVGGICSIGTCSAGFGNCDGNAANGCETSTTTSTVHCGMCGRACSFANAAASCAAGTCVMGACAAGFANCDGLAANGCETNLNTSATSCGACGTRCSFANASASCAAGVCSIGACNVGFGNCDGLATNGCEMDVTSSRLHCGRCGLRCPLGSVCFDGLCEIP